MKRKPVVLGLDLSLRSTGMVALSHGWALDWSRVPVATAGAELEHDATEHEQLERLRRIRVAVLQFAVRHRCTHAAVLGYAFNMAAMSRAHAAGELGGVVKLGLLEAGIDVRRVVESSARTLLGRAPRKGAKAWCTQRLVEVGAPRAWPQDCLDAFVGANWLMSECGGDALILPRVAA